MRGRKPKPTRLKVLTGNPGGRPLAKNEPTAPKSSPGDPPDWMPANGKEEWSRVAPILKNAGLFTELDRGPLEGLCVSYACWRQAIEEMRKNGLLMNVAKTGKCVGKKQNPGLSIAHHFLSQYKAYFAEFGMSPSARLRLAPGAAEDEDDAFLSKNRRNGVQARPADGKGAFDA